MLIIPLFFFPARVWISIFSNNLKTRTEVFWDFAETPNTSQELKIKIVIFGHGRDLRLFADFSAVQLFLILDSFFSS